MPSRIIRPGINDSERIDQLDWSAEVFYRRLLNAIDDHGLYDARPQKLRADLFPLRTERISLDDISRWLSACEQASLIVLYQSEGKPYLKVLDTRWKIRSEPKWPLPPSNIVTEKQLQTGVNSCGPTIVCRVSSVVSRVSSHGDRPPEADVSPPYLKFPIQGGGEWVLTQAKAKEYEETFSKIDVPASLRKARQWCADNEAKRKTARGMPRFLNSWLSNERQAKATPQGAGEFVEDN